MTTSRATAFRLTYLIAFMVGNAAIVSAAEVFVAGVAVSDSDSKQRMGEIAVRLSASQNNGGSLATDVTNVDGIYNLTATGLQAQVQSLWVTVAPPAIADPVAAQLNFRNGSLFGKAPDIIVRSLKPNMSQAEAINFLRPVQETAIIGIWSGNRDASIKQLTEGTRSIMRS